VEAHTHALGADRRVILTHSDTFHLRQARGFEQTLAKARRRLATLQARLAFSPMFHWTDQKIRVHVFHCVLALAVAHLLRRQATQAGLHLSVRELHGTLADIQETVLLYQGARGRPRARHVLTEMDPIQQRLYDLFGLHTYGPKR
jgi:hypothetical protein